MPVPGLVLFNKQPLSPCDPPGASLSWEDNSEEDTVSDSASAAQSLGVTWEIDMQILGLYLGPTESQSAFLTGSPGDSETILKFEEH